jgi:hypothetical protein
MLNSELSGIGSNSVSNSKKKLFLIVLARNLLLLETLAVIITVLDLPTIFRFCYRRRPTLRI